MRQVFLFVEKPDSGGKLRLVTDFRNLNANLKRPVWPFAMTDKICRFLDNGDRYFVKVDLVSGYHQIPIQESDRDLTCFLLPWGKYRYCVLPMGLSPSGDIFCYRTDKAVQGLPGIKKQVDDCLASGKTVGGLEVSLVGLLDRCRTHNIKISKRKFKLGRSIEFGGFLIDGSGEDLRVGPAPSRIEAIKAMEVPRSKRQVREFLGLVRTLGAWTPHISMSTRLMRKEGCHLQVVP